MGASFMVEDHDSTASSDSYYLVQPTSVAEGGPSRVEGAWTARDPLIELKRRRDMEIEGLHQTLEHLPNEIEMLAVQVLEDTADPEEFRKEFERRLQGMASHWPNAAMVKESLEDARDHRIPGREAELSKLLHELKVKGLKHSLNNVAHRASVAAPELRRETDDPEEFRKKFPGCLQGIAFRNRTKSGLVKEILKRTLDFLALAQTGKVFN
jgi:hypothetical protein